MGSLMQNRLTQRRALRTSVAVALGPDDNMAAHHTARPLAEFVGAAADLGLDRGQRSHVQKDDPQR
jgi:hypothetical protein